MTGRAAADALAATLNEVCRAAVSAAHSGDAAAIAALSANLSADAAQRPPDDDAAAFLRALAAVLAGTPATIAAASLHGPWRAGLLAVAGDMVAADPRRETDWVAALAARVAETLRHRDHTAARTVADQLNSLARMSDLDPAAAAYLNVLHGVLAGRDVRAASLRLVEPYRSGYLSLLAVVRGEDPRTGLIERVRDNAVLVLSSGDETARAALAEALADVELDAARTEAGEISVFIGAVRARLQGDLGSVPAVSDPALIAAWAAVTAVRPRRRSR